MSKLKKIPKFNSEKKQLFWEKADSTDFIDWSKAKLAKAPNLKYSTNSTFNLYPKL
jgi:hypothetical protein